MKRTLFLSALLLAACGPESTSTVPAVSPKPEPTTTSVVTAAPPVDFRATAPKGEEDKPFTPPKIEEARLSNGVRVLVVERHDLPIVSLEIVTDRGADQGAPGVGGFVGAMLLQGTKTRSALETSDALGALGAQYGSFGGFDALGVHAKVLAKSFPEALAILADAFRNPAFDKKEIERERSKRLTDLARQKDSPGVLLRNTVAEVLYPAAHPYHAPLLGTEEAVKKIGRDDLAKFHGANVVPAATTVVVVGDVTKDQAVAAVEKAFGSWKAPAGKATEVAPVDAAPDATVIVVDKPGLTQSYVSAATVGVPRKTDDFAAIQVMNTILGGQFSSRLNMNLREKHTYTYGARSGFEMRHGAGPFDAGGAIVRDATVPAVKEILGELARIRDAEVTDDELAIAKANLVRRLPGSFETVSDVAGSVGALAVHGLPLDEYATRAARVQAVTKADVQRVAKTYLRADRMRIVIVGDAAAFEKELEGLGKIDLRKAPAPEPKAPVKSAKTATSAKTTPASTTGATTGAKTTGATTGANTTGAKTTGK